MTDETPATTPSKTVYLLDGTSQLYRAFFALPPMNTATGQPTNAVFGYTSMLRKLLNEHDPGWLGVAFDLPGKTFRSDSYPDYKANRPPTPDALRSQAPLARQVTEVLGVPIVERPGFEADDLIATYTAVARRAGHEVVVVSSDKDLMQLVGDGVRMFNPSKEIWLDAAGVEETFGVPPERVLDAQGLMGDSVDNIPGVPGVGGKTAISIVATYGELESIIARAGRFVAVYDARDALLECVKGLEDEALATEGAVEGVLAASTFLTQVASAFVADEVDAEIRGRVEELLEALVALPAAPLRAAVGEKGKAAAKPLRAIKKLAKGLDKGSLKRQWYAIHEHAAQARMSRELATLVRDVPEVGGLEALEMREPDAAIAAELFGTLEFKALVGEFTAGEPSPGGDVAVATGDYETVTDEAGLRSLADAIVSAGRCAIEAVAGAGGPFDAPLVGLALSPGAGLGSYVPVGHTYLGAPTQLEVTAVAAVLGPVLGNPAVAVVGADLKAVEHLLRRHGMPIANWALDITVAGFLLDSDRSDYRLPRLAAQYLGGREVESENLRLGSGAKRIAAADAEVERVAAWRAERADVTGQLATELRSRLEDDKLAELYDTIDGPLLPVLARMEARGIRVDTDLLSSMSAEMEVALDALRGDIHELAGQEFNVDSPKQLREILFDGLGLKSKRKTAKSKVASTDAQTLEELVDQHPIAGKLLEYRELSKLKSTYVDALPRLVDPATQRVHTRYDPTGAATGRLSSSDPNLQNIPVRTEAGRRVRKAFVAEDGYVFLASDYSQVELRILAHLTGDAGLTRAFRAGEDIHSYTAAKVAGIMPELVTTDMRRRAKAVNFGILYGMSDTRLAREQGISRSDARKFIESYFDRFSSVRDYIDGVRESVMRDGEVHTIFGRVRRFPQLRQRVHRGIVEQAMRAAVNTTCQGTAADLMKMAMLRVDAALEREGLGARMLLQVHDELLLEVPEAEVEVTRDVVRRAMEDVWPLEVPLTVDQKTGADWREV